ncbi:MAG TPA: hypothetical protein VKC60_12845 [Opitutaceae bacterium]|nr:hypothetical protein [Opitutaceae bacterium]
MSVLIAKCRRKDASAHLTAGSLFSSVDIYFRKLALGIRLRWYVLDLTQRVIR